MNNLIEKLYNIDNLKKRLDESRPLSTDITKSLKIKFDIAIINNSIRGKGNTFTLQEIKALLFDGSTICGKTDIEQLEITDYKNALDYIEVLSEKKLIELTAIDIINIHNILFKNIAPEKAGKYRNCPLSISLENGKEATVCDPFLIPDEMNKFFNWLLTEKNEHSLIIAAEAHNKFVEIHPFYDGNGRTGRLIMNLILMNKGYVPIIIKPYKRTENYDNTIISWRNGNKDDFYIFIADCEIESLEEYLKIINKENRLNE